MSPTTGVPAIASEALAAPSSRLGRLFRRLEPYIEFALPNSIRHWAHVTGDRNPHWAEVTAPEATTLTGGNLVLPRGEN